MPGECLVRCLRLFCREIQRSRDRPHLTHKAHITSSACLPTNGQKRSHSYAALDVENFRKPSFETLAAGLFCDNAQDSGEISQYSYDDSNFRHLFVHRLEDAESEDGEGAGFVVSIRRRPAKAVV